MPSLLAGCAGTPSRTGGDVAAVDLRVVYGNSAGSIGSDVIDELARPGAATPVTVRNRSAELDPDAGASEDAEGVALVHLARGEADLTILRAGRLAMAGASSLAVLQAPMVVTNGEQAQRIARDPLALRAMRSLERIGLVGVAVVPGSLRHLIGYRTAVTEPGQLAGRSLSMKRDSAARAIAAALGAIPDERVGAARSAGAASGVLRAIDASLDQAAAVDRPAVVVSDLPVYEKFDVVVIRRAVWLGLSGAQRRSLAARVSTAVDRALSSRVSEEQELADWCALPGGSAIVATPAERAAFHTALDPVAARLAAGGGEPLLARMRALRDGTDDPPGVRCEGGAAAPRAAFDLAPVGDQTVLDGTWRADATAAALAAAGGTGQEVANNAGIWTFRIAGGRAEVDQPVGPDCTMRFTFAGDRVRLDEAVEGNDACNGLSVGSWRRDGNVAHLSWRADLDGQPRFVDALWGTLRRVEG